MTFFYCISVFSVDWKVTYTPRTKCVPLGSSVDIECSYLYPSGHAVQKTSWKKQGQFIDFSSTTNQGNLIYLGDKKNNCTLRITNVKQSDEGEYTFRFEIDQRGKGWTAKTAFTLSVTGDFSPLKEIIKCMYILHV